MLNQTWYISWHSSLYHTIGDPESPGSSASRFSIFGKRYWIMSLNLVISETTCAMCNTWFGIRLLKIVPEVLSFYPQAMAPERVLPLRFSFFFSSRNSSHNLQTKMFPNKNLHLKWFTNENLSNVNKQMIVNK